MSELRRWLDEGRELADEGRALLASRGLLILRLDSYRWWWRTRQWERRGKRAGFR